MYSIKSLQWFFMGVLCPLSPIPWKSLISTEFMFKNKKTTNPFANLHYLKITIDHEFGRCWSTKFFREIEDRDTYVKLPLRRNLKGKKGTFLYFFCILRWFYHDFSSQISAKWRGYIKKKKKNIVEMWIIYFKW